LFDKCTYLTTSVETHFFQIAKRFKGHWAFCKAGNIIPKHMSQYLRVYFLFDSMVNVREYQQSL